MDEQAPSRDGPTVAVRTPRETRGMDAIAARLHLRAYHCERDLVLLRRRLARARLTKALELEFAFLELGRARRALREARRVIWRAQACANLHEVSFRCAAFAGGSGVARLALSAAAALVPEADRISDDLRAVIAESRTAAILARLSPAGGREPAWERNRSDGL